MPRYDFGWVHEDAAHLKYGSFDLRIHVSAGNIVTVEKLGGTERKIITLSDQQRKEHE